MPKLSIVLPIYNVEKYLNRCIDSLLNQTFNDFEIILVNDGSTDNCAYICNEFKKKDNRIKVVHKKNGGVSSARNAGMEIVSSEFIGFVDPDDYLEVDALEYLYQLAIENEADIACYSAKIYKKGSLKSKMNSDEKISIYYNSDIIKMQSKEVSFQHSVWNKIYSKKILKENNIKFEEEIHYAEDAIFNYKVMSKAKKIVHSNLQKYNYFINENSTVASVTKKRLDILNAQKEIYKFLSLNYSDCSRNIVNEYINSSISIVIDIVNENNILKKYYLLRELKKVVRRDKDILKDKSLVSLKNKFLFLLLNISPFIIAILYKLRFSIEGVR